MNYQQLLEVVELQKTIRLSCNEKVEAKLKIGDIVKVYDSEYVIAQFAPLGNGLVKVWKYQLKDPQTLSNYVSYLTLDNLFNRSYKIVGNILDREQNKSRIKELEAKRSEIDAQLVKLRGY